MTGKEAGAVSVEEQRLSSNPAEALKAFWEAYQRPEVAGVFADKEGGRFLAFVCGAPAVPLAAEAEDGIPLSDEEWLSFVVRSHAEIFEQEAPRSGEAQYTDPLPLLASLLHDIEMEAADTVVGLAFRDVDSLSAFFREQPTPRRSGAECDRRAAEKARVYAPYQLRKNRTARAGNTLLGYPVYFVSALPERRPAVLARSSSQELDDYMLNHLRSTNKDRPFFDRLYLSRYIENTRSKVTGGETP